MFVLTFCVSAAVCDTRPFFAGSRPIQEGALANRLDTQSTTQVYYAPTTRVYEDFNPNVHHVGFGDQGTGSQPLHESGSPPPVIPVSNSRPQTQPNNNQQPAVIAPRPPPPPPTNVIQGGNPSSPQTQPQPNQPNNFNNFGGQGQQPSFFNPNFQQGGFGGPTGPANGGFGFPGQQQGGQNVAFNPQQGQQGPQGGIGFPAQQQGGFPFPQFG